MVDLMTAEEQEASKKSHSQFERRLTELESAVKHGPVPQAKGRVEGLFSTSRIDRSKGCVCRESLLGCGDSIHGDLSLVLD